MTTPITRPCPHCGVDYDITRRLNGDQCWCPCGKWSTVVVSRLPGLVFLMPCEPPPGTEPAQDPTADATLVAEMSALRAELEAAKEDNAALLAALREIDSSEWLPPRVQHLLNRISVAEHPGRALTAELTRRMSDLEQERDAAVAVVAVARRGFEIAEDVVTAEAFDPVALARAIERFDKATDRKARP